MVLSTLLYLLVLLVVAFLGGVLVKTFKQPPIIGYLLAGLTLGILFSSRITHETVDFLSELGVILLLFTLGLEFSLTRIQRVAKIAIVGGILQILLTIVVATSFIIWLGFAWYVAVFMAAAFSLSSTAIVVKLLSDKGEMDTLPGEIMVGWLVIQDLAVLPMMILLPVLGIAAAGAPFSISIISSLIQNSIFSVSILVFIVLLGRLIVPRVLSYVAGLNSRELLVVAVFATAVAGATITQLLGLSPALGAFLAGFLIAESVATHAVFSEVRPLRDIFSVLFFTTLGLLLPSGFIFSHFGTIMLLTIVVMLVKFIAVSGLSLYLGYHLKTSFVVGIGLIEIGEFAFVLAQLGLSEKIIDQTTFGLIVSVALLSILIMPPLFIGAPSLYLAFRNFTKARMGRVYTRFFARSEHQLTLEELPYSNHVVICGFGRVGKYIGRSLEMAEIPFIVIEYNHQKAEELRKQGIEVVYGDPADIDILDFAQVDKARSLIIAIPDLHTQKLVVTNALTLNKHIDIYCRTHHEEDQKHLKALGVTSIIQPEFEASLSIVGKLLKSLGHKDEVIEGKISRLKIEHGLG